MRKILEMIIKILFFPLFIVTAVLACFIGSVATFGYFKFKYLFSMMWQNYWSEKLLWD